jgi:hypothetical protein
MSLFQRIFNPRGYPSPSWKAERPFMIAAGIWISAATYFQIKYWSKSKLAGGKMFVYSSTFLPLN